MQAISPGPVCPQSMPSFPKNHNTANGSEEEEEALSRMPKPRLRFLQMIRAQLLRQSEDCLYLNIFVPQSAIDRRDQGRQFLTASSFAEAVLGIVFSFCVFVTEHKLCRLNAINDNMEYQVGNSESIFRLSSAETLLRFC